MSELGNFGTGNTELDATLVDTGLEDPDYLLIRITKRGGNRIIAKVGLNIGDLEAAKICRQVADVLETGLGDPTIEIRET